MSAVNRNNINVVNSNKTLEKRIISFAFIGTLLEHWLPQLLISIKNEPLNLCMRLSQISSIQAKNYRKIRFHCEV